MKISDTEQSASHYRNMNDILARWYGDQMYTRHDIHHPFVVYQPNESQSNDVDSVLGRIPEAVVARESLAISDIAYLHDLQNSGRELYNGTTFSFKYLRLSPLRIEASLGKYFDMLITSGALEREVRKAATGKFARLLNRTQLHRQHTADVVLTRGAGRDAAIGVATLIIFQHQEQYQALLARRSARTATDPGFYHVLPAFIFQPGDDSFQHPQEWSVKHQIFREYLEELFGLPEVPAPDQFDYFYEHPALRYLQELMQSGGASLHLTGIAMNLLTLRPEICTLLLIHDPAWYTRVTAQDSDMPLKTAAETDGNSIVFANIETDESLFAALPPQLHTIMPPQATAALWLGIDLARKIVRNRDA